MKRSRAARFRRRYPGADLLWSMGSGMEEIFQITSALKYLSFGKHVAVITDARFSGVSTGACIGHVGPEALAGGPIGKLTEGDRVQIMIDRNKLEGSLDLVGHGDKVYGPERGSAVLAERPLRPDLSPNPDLPDDTRLWAALQRVGGGTWGGASLMSKRSLVGWPRAPPEKRSASPHFCFGLKTQVSPVSGASSQLAASALLPTPGVCTLMRCATNRRHPPRLQQASFNQERAGGRTAPQSGCHRLSG